MFGLFRLFRWYFRLFRVDFVRILDFSYVNSFLISAESQTEIDLINIFLKENKPVDIDIVNL